MTDRHGPGVKVVTVKVGFLGLGRTGLPLARRLAAVPDDVTLVVHDRDPAAVAALVTAGARPADDLTDLVRAVDVLLVRVGDDERARAVVDAVLPFARMGLTVVLLDPVAPDVAVALAERAAGRGVLLVDAPVPRVAADRPVLEVGGSAAAYAVARGPLEVLAASVRHAGPVGSASVAGS